MTQALFKIGDLARRTGLTVRALHHYDAIGLLSPTVRTASGARCYGPQDLVRLHRIQAMKQLGYALPDIKTALDDTAHDPIDTLRRQAQALEARARQARKLSQGLRALMDQLADGQVPSPSDWLDSLEMMAIHQQHFAEEEVRALYVPRHEGGRQIEQQWSQLVAEIGQAMDDALPTEDPRAHALAWRWIRLVIRRTGNSPALAIKLRTLQTQDARAQVLTGITPAMMDWVSRAITLARIALFARYLTPEQTATLHARQLQSMEDPDCWARLMAKVQVQFEAGTPVESAAVQSLAREWQALFRASYCGEDTDLEARVRTALAQEPDLMLGVGVSAPLMAYIREAMDRLSTQ